MKALFIASLVAIAPVASYAQSTPAATTAGIWLASSSSAGECQVTAQSGGYIFGLGADTVQPDTFTVGIMGPFPPNTPPKAALYFGAGLSQTIVGQASSDGHGIAFRLGNDPTNNFATFLHGFTAGTTMSVVIGSTALDFSLAGTSAIVGVMGQCTVADNFNSLPMPWHPAAQTVSAQVNAVTPNLFPQPTEPSATSTPDGITILPSYQASAEAAPPVAQPAPVVPTAPPISAPDDIYASDGSMALLDCSDPSTDQILSLTIQNMPAYKTTGLQIYSVDSITSEATSSGRQLCHASVYTSQGTLNFAFQWVAHKGAMYMWAQIAG